MSWQASTWALNQKVGNPTKKLILLGFADHAHADGTAAFNGKAKLAEYAECSLKSVQRYTSDLMDDGFIREGDQSLVDHYPANSRPVVYNLAMTDETRRQWALEAQTPGANPQRDRFRAIGKKGADQLAENKKSANPQVSGTDNLSVRDSAHTTSGGTDNLSVPESDLGTDTGVPSGGTVEGARYGHSSVAQTTQELPTPTGNLPAPVAEPEVVVGTVVEATASPAGSAGKKGTRLDPGFLPSGEMVAWAREQTPLVDGRVEHEKFVDFWIAKPGKDGVKLDWPATWRNWFRNAQQRLETSAATPRRGDIDWTQAEAKASQMTDWLGDKGAGA